MWFCNKWLAQANNNRWLLVLYIGTLLLCGVVMTGCSQNAVFTPSVADLNAKAQVLLQQGDAPAAIARLESARDLSPEEPNTLFNLAVAYLTADQPEKAIPLLEKLDHEQKLTGKKLNQTLGVAYESAADRLAGQEKLTPEQVSQAVEFYQKAIGQLERLDKRERIPGLQEQIATVQKKLS
jgi:predicted Zn-dependent protease